MKVTTNPVTYRETMKFQEVKQTEKAKEGTAVKVKKTEQIQEAQKQEQKKIEGVQVSRTSENYSTEQKRAEKIQELKRQINNKTFEITPDKIAQKMANDPDFRQRMGQ